MVVSGFGPQSPDGHDNQVDGLPGGGETPRHRVGGRFGTHGVEIHRLHVLGPGVTGAVGCFVQPLGMAGCQDDGVTVSLDQTVDDGLGDVGGATQHHDRSGAAKRVVHIVLVSVRPRRRERSEAKIPSGSTRRHTAASWPSRGYMVDTRSGSSRASLAR